MTSMSNKNDENSQPSTLERRYRRLLWAYPADYRAERGPEIVGTYLDLAGSDRRWPSLSDVADLLHGGLRQRLRAADSLGLIDGVRLAAALALPVAVALATAWLMTVETAWLSGVSFVAFPPFLTLGAVVWIGWLAAAALATVLPGRWVRTGIAVALVLTVVVVPASALTGYLRPPLYVLAPQIALGALALALPTRSRRWGWIAVLTGVAVATAAVMLRPPAALSIFAETGYYWLGEHILGVAALVLVSCSLVAGVGYALRHDSRGLWAALVLLTPISLLAVHPVARSFAGTVGNGPLSWAGLAGTTALLTVIAAALTPLTVALRHRLPRREPDRCPACGQRG